jgi:redox-sensitive bicupin YhaK (pirin superfamily)
MIKKLDNVYTPAEHPGFLGTGHVARHVIEGDFRQSDPFIMLADDWLDKKTSEPVGGAHPHAGFETVTLVLAGELDAGDHKMVAGDFQLMTAGSGIVHAETIDKKQKMRILQLWLTLPEKSRWTTPRVQDLSAANVPVKSEGDTTIRVYSGTFANVSSPILNHVPLMLVDIKLQPGARLNEPVPAGDTAFMYVIDGSVSVGEKDQPLRRDEVGWLSKSDDTLCDDLQLTAGEDGARVILYSAEPQGDYIVSHGPFIGNTDDDIRRLYKEFREGKMKHVSTLPKENVWAW